jgi:hypothetical protein
MNASLYEQEHWRRPRASHHPSLAAAEVREACKRRGARPSNSNTPRRMHRRASGTGETVTLEADQVFKAIGQTLAGAPWMALTLESGKIAVDATGRTSRRQGLGRRRLRRRRRRPDRDRRRRRQDRRLSIQGQSGCARHCPGINRPEIADLGRITSWLIFHQFPRHQVAQSVLAGLRAADRQGIQCRARLRGRLGRRGLEDAGRAGPAGRQCQRPALRRDHGPTAAARPQQHRADHRPPARVNLREIAQVKRDWPDRAMIVSLMVPCEEESWKAILPRSRTPAPTASS